MSSFEDDFIRENIDLLVFCARKAGHLARTDERFTSLQNQVCVVPTGREGITRAIRPLLLQTSAPVIDFVPQNLVLVGGAALQVYSRAFADIGMPVFSEPIHDADFVWWPRIQYPPNFANMVKAHGQPFYPEDGTYLLEANPEAETYGITSYSPAIHMFAELTAKHLEALFTKYLTKISDSLAATLSQHGKPVLLEEGRLKFHIHVKKTHTYRAGVFNVNCVLESGDFQTTFFELAIHDGCSSQISAALLDKQHDEMYVSDSEHTEGNNYINYIGGKQIPEIDIVLPKIEKLLLQQWLALQNRIKNYELSNNQSMLEKIQKHYTRIDYIFNILYMLYKMDPQTEFYKKCVDTLHYTPNPRFVTFVENTIFTNEYWLIPCTHRDVRNCTKDVNAFWRLCRRGRILNRQLCDQLAPPQPPLPPLPPPQPWQKPTGRTRRRRH